MDDVRSLHAPAADGETGAAAGAQEGGIQPQETVEEYAKKVDFEVLQAALTEDQLYHQSLTARKYGVGAMVVRPCDVDSALRFLSLGVVRVASTVGHPFGSSATGVKVFECRDLLRRGAKQINAYINPGKMHSRQFQHQEVELIQMADSCIEAGATLKVMLDNQLLNDEMKIILCRMAKRINADYIATTHPRDLELILKHCGDRVRVEVGGVTTLEQATEALRLGCSRVRTHNPQALLEAYSVSLKAGERAT